MIAPRHLLRLRRRFNVAATLVVAAIATFGLQGCQQDASDERKVDITRATVSKMAFEGYPAWGLRPSNTGKCPTAEQLGEYMSVAPKDAWGEALIIRCKDLPPGAMGIAVMSKGADKKPDTADDVKSWDL